MTPPAGRRMIARLDDETYEVDVAGSHVSVAGAAEPLEVRPGPAGVVLAEQSGRRRTAYVAPDGDTRWVFVDGDVFEITVVPRSAYRRTAAGHHHESLSAPMPATVVRLVAPPGTTVRRGDVVLVLEAMKMELPIRAPHDGCVEAVHCREGDLVQPGVPLVDLDETGDA